MIAAQMLAMMLAEFGPPSGHRPSRQDQPWAAGVRQSKTRTWDAFEGRRSLSGGRMSTAAIRAEIHAEVVAAGPAVLPERAS